MHRGATQRGAALFWAAAYFAAALLPRLSPLVAGVLFGDDFIHRPEGHLQSYRFLNYAELSFWELLFGPRYLMGAAPKIIAALYTTGLCAALRASLREWGAAPRVANLLLLLLPLHPLWNTFIVWNSTGVYVLSLLLIVLGYRWLSRAGARFTIGAILMMAVGISGYQVHLGLLPALVFAEIVLSEEKLRSWPRIAARRVLACGAAAGLYFLATKLALFAGLETWGGRGLASNVTGVMGFSAIHRVADNLAVITQPFLSFYGGLEAAWRLWTVPYLVTAVLTVLVLSAGRRFAAATTTALLTLVLPLSAASVVVALNFPPSGPRVAAAIWIATLLATLPFLQRLDAMRRWPVAAMAVLFIALALPVTLTDAKNWRRAWEADPRTANAILQQWGSASGVTIAIHGTDLRRPLPEDWESRPIVMQNFTPVTPFEYSNIVYYPEWMLASYGFRVVFRPTDMPRPPTTHSELAEWRHEPAQRETLLAPYGWRPRH